jgi:hypothetical protein
LLYLGSFAALAVWPLRYTIEIRFLDPGAEAYAFTFG